MWQDQISFDRKVVQVPYDPFAEWKWDVSVSDVDGDRVLVQPIGSVQGPFWVHSSSLKSLQKESAREWVAKRILLGDSIEKIASDLRASPQRVRDFLYSRGQPSIVSLINSSLGYVYTIWGMSDTNRSWSGSGFIFNSQAGMLTCNHVTDPTGFSYSRRDLFAKGEEHQGKVEVVASSSSLDVSVCRIEGLDDSDGYLPLGSSSDDLPGEQIVALGSPEGIELVATVGYVATSERRVDGAPAIFIDVDIFPGSSGGPVLASDGTVVGIARGTVGEEGMAGLNYVIPIDLVRDWLDNVGIDF